MAAREREENVFFVDAAFERVGVVTSSVEEDAVESVPAETASSAVAGDVTPVRPKARSEIIRAMKARIALRVMGVTLPLSGCGLQLQTRVFIPRFAFQKADKSDISLQPG
jgi:hypothetical protein